VSRRDDRSFGREQLKLFESTDTIVLARGRPPFTDRVSNPAGQRDTADAHRAGVSESGGETVSSDTAGVFDGRQPCLGPGGPIRRVHLQRLQIAAIEHDAVVNRAVAGAAVAAASDGQRKPCFSRQGDRACDVRSIRRKNDDCGMPIETAP
jgi:hypothetical protein